MINERKNNDFVKLLIESNANNIIFFHEEMHNINQ